ncbi:MAG: dockerin type I repeat-containing protein [Oscillospiraceae bacterium]|nr:dockerin type I repeat-containing protein [Oscillospiraceae bacterium]
MQRKAKRILSIVLCLVLAFSMMSVGALATTYTAPTSGVVANDNILTGSGSNAGSTALSILGINMAAINTSNALLGSGGQALSDEWGTDSENLGIFGSDVNDNPDAYIYNYFYNYNSTKSGGTTYSLDDYSSWNASPYTLIGNMNTSITISVGGVTKTCSTWCFYEPDIHILFLGDPSADIEAYQETYNADYNPVVVSLNSQSAARTDGLGNAYNMFEMSTNLRDIGKLSDELAESLGKTTRYADSAWEIGSNYDKLCRGYYYWAQLMFEVYDGSLTDEEIASLESYGVDIDALGGGLQKLRGVRSFSYDADTDSWTIQNTTNRFTQFASGIVEDVYDILTAEIAAGTRDSYVISTDELLEYLNPEGREPGVIITGTTAKIDSSVSEKLEEAGIRTVSNLPSTVYNIGVQARENALGQPYYLSYFYYDQLADMTDVNMTLNPISLIFYWVKNFYHVSDNDAMQTVIVNMMESADLPAGLVVTDSATTDSYGSDVEAAIENMIILGMKYYLAVEEPRLDAAGEEKTVATDEAGVTQSSGTNWAYWTSLTEDDLAMGIGSGDIYLNPEGNGVENRHLNAQNYASDGTVETFYTEYSSYIKDGTVTATDMTYGDINGDGSIDSADVVIVLRAVAGTLTLTSTQETYADVTGDGAVGVADAVMILQYIVGTVTSLTPTSGG